MKGNKMPLVESLENATDEEIIEAGKHMRLRLIKKFFLGVALSVAVSLASDFLVAIIDNKKKDKELTE